MAEERDVVDIDDAADKSEAESSIKWTYHCDSENSTDLGESYKSFAPAMSSLAQVADKLQGIFQSSFPALESLKTISQRMQNLIPGWQEMQERLANSVYPIVVFEKACKCYKVTDWPLALVLSGAEEEEVANLYDMGMSDDELRVALTEWSLSVFDRERVESIGGKWEEYSFISLEARKLLDLALSRHLDGDYIASTLISITQLEGLLSSSVDSFNAFAYLDNEVYFCVAKRAGLNREKVSRNVKDHAIAMASIADKGFMRIDSAIDYLVNITLTNAESFDELAVDNPLRNKICHGCQMNYGTKVHSLKSILAVDTALKLGAMARASVSEKNETQVFGEWCPLTMKSDMEADTMKQCMGIRDVLLSGGCVAACSMTL